MRLRLLFSAGMALTLICGFVPVSYAQPADAAPVKTKAATKLTLDTPIEKIYADPRGKKIMDNVFPDMRRHQAYPQFKALSLNRLASASGGAITSAQLKKADIEFRKVEIDD